MSRLLLVPGGWHGAWAYGEVLPILRAAGHEAEALTLSGLDPDDEHPGPINLETHIDDVVSALRQRREPAILAAHSYGGMLIAAAVERAPALVKGLVYIDAYVPADGDSCWSLTTERFRQMVVHNAGADGLSVVPSQADDPRARPHPLATLVQRVRLSGNGTGGIPRDYVYLSDWASTPFAGLYARLREDPSWHVWELPRKHNLPLEDPSELAEMLLAIAAREKESAGCAG